MCKPLPLAKFELARSARDVSMTRLRSYRVGITTDDDFLRAGWRESNMTRPYGDIGISGTHAKIDSTEWAVVYSEYTLGYYDARKGDVKVCTLHFDAAGLLQSIHWEAGSEIR